jgi:hypothetical protein
MRYWAALGGALWSGPCARICLHTAPYVSSYCYVCVLITQVRNEVLDSARGRFVVWAVPAHVREQGAEAHLLIYVSLYCYICVLILLYMCPHTAVCVLIPLNMCPHTVVHVSPYCYICVLIPLNMCPHTTIYVSSDCCMCSHATIWLGHMLA